MRINKYIAHAGVASRRKAEELIKQGLVTQYQVVRELATIIKTGDQVVVEGTPPITKKRSTILNKPRGVISSVSDDKGRTTVVDLYLKYQSASTQDVWLGYIWCLDFDQWWRFYRWDIHPQMKLIKSMYACQRDCQ